MSLCGGRTQRAFQNPRSAHDMLLIWFRSDFWKARSVLPMRYSRFNEHSLEPLADHILSQWLGPVAGDRPGCNSPLQDSALQPGLTPAPPGRSLGNFLNPPLHFAPWRVRSPTLSPAAAVGPVASFRSRLQKIPKRA
jgi:hypothetical protein